MRSDLLQVKLNMAKNGCFTINFRKDKKLGKKNKKRKTEGSLEQKSTKEQQPGIKFPEIKGAGIYLRSSKVSRSPTLFKILLHCQFVVFTKINYFRLYWVAIVFNILLHWQMVAFTSITYLKLYWVATIFNITAVLTFGSIHNN